jgi:hypothetical protein
VVACLPVIWRRFLDDLLLRHDAQINDFACLRHVIGELLVTSCCRFIHRGFNSLQIRNQFLIGFTEQLHGKTERFAQARYFDGTAGDVRGMSESLADSAATCSANWLPALLSSTRKKPPASRSLPAVR